MHVTALLNTKGHDVVTIEATASVRDAVGTMREHQIGALVVTGPGAPIVGIISERDVVRHLSLRGASILDEPVAQLMSSSVTTCEPSTSCTVLMGLMTEHRIRHVPVLEAGELVGIVSIGDVVKARLDELERERRDLLDYVSAR
jgi:CBS domain-containing protein